MEIIWIDRYFYFRFNNLYYIFFNIFCSGGGGIGGKVEYSKNSKRYVESFLFIMILLRKIKLKEELLFIF